MIKRYVVAIATQKANGGLNRSLYPIIEMVYPKREFDTIQEAEASIERMLSLPSQSFDNYIILTQYSKS